MTLNKDYYIGLYEERAAIRQFDGNESKKWAETHAEQEIRALLMEELYKNTTQEINFKLFSTHNSTRVGLILRDWGIAKIRIGKEYS